MSLLSRSWSRKVSAALVALTVGVGAATLAAPPASALSAGVTFSAESLPTWQVDGFAYAASSSRGRVVVGGNFTKLVPPAGQTATAVATAGLAILDADSGAPSSCQLSAGNASGTKPTIYAVNTSPDGNTVYVGGDFTSIAGVAVQRFAAIDVVSCQVTALRVAGISSLVLGITSTSSAVYLAGEFTKVGTVSRPYFAAVSPSSGALLPFAPVVDKPGRAMTVSPDGQRLAIGGAFTTVNGSASHSIAVVNASTGATVKAYGATFVPAASITKTIVSDSTGFYVGNEGTGSGVFDGRLAVDWSTLNERWRDTCLGATQALVVLGGILYSGSHSHDCGSIGYYPDGVRKYFVAETTDSHTFRGWSPTANDGVNEKIGPRGLAVVKGNGGASYLYAVGEFTQINGVQQQGITRFGTVDSNAPAAPYIQAEALQSNSVQVRVWTVVDSDDDTLTYRIYRNGGTTPVWTGKATSFWWTRPQITFTDTAVEPGKSYSYKVTASDGSNTSALSSAAAATAKTKSVDYPSQVVADGAQLYWRYEESSGTWTWDKGVDSTSAFSGQLGKGAAFGAAGVNGSKGASFDGVDDYAYSDQMHTAPSVFTLETWFKTTTTAGGRLIGFSDGQPSTLNGVPVVPTSYDRHIYMDNGGKLNFGTYNGSSAVVTSAKAYNDGSWHHVVGTFGSAGTTLYVDGASVGTNPRNVASSYRGIWKVGGEKLDGWPNAPTSRYFAGSIDETAVYEGKALTAAAVANHYRLGGGVQAAAASTTAPVPTPTAPTRRTVTLAPVEDTMVAENNPSYDYGSYGQLSTRKSTAKDELQSYLRFDLAGVAPDAKLVAANLTLTTSNDSTAGSVGASQVSLLTSRWSDAVTWPSRPSQLGPVLGTLGSAPAVNTSYDVTLDASGLSRDDAGTVSLALTSASADNLRISSREGAKAPKLTLTYES